ncbi:hypothetical protein J6590_006745 [Homalodisca vitripennis]|nr:hypothetical protein J6590_006745 [Homalodisca vitripennis]
MDVREQHITNRKRRDWAVEFPGILQQGNRVWNAKIAAVAIRIFPSDLENPGEGYVECSHRIVPIFAARVLKFSLLKRGRRAPSRLYEQPGQHRHESTTQYNSTCNASLIIKAHKDKA